MVSVAREGAQQAWAMLQMHYPGLDIRKVAKVGPKGPDEKEMKPNSNFQWVMPFARLTEQDCRLDKIIE